MSANFRLLRASNVEVHMSGSCHGQLLSGLGNPHLWHRQSADVGCICQLGWAGARQRSTYTDRSCDFQFGPMALEMAATTSLSSVGLTHHWVRLIREAQRYTDRSRHVQPLMAFYDPNPWNQGWVSSTHESVYKDAAHRPTSCSSLVQLRSAKPALYGNNRNRARRVRLSPS
jgi:hypothetical protein